MNSFLVMVVQPEVYFSRWRLPPSWISNNCCHFIRILIDRSNVSSYILNDFDATYILMFTLFIIFFRILFRIIRMRLYDKMKYDSKRHL